MRAKQDPGSGFGNLHCRPQRQYLRRFRFRCGPSGKAEVQDRGSGATRFCFTGQACRRGSPHPDTPRADVGASQSAKPAFHVIRWKKTVPTRLARSLGCRRPVESIRARLRLFGSNEKEKREMDLTSTKFLAHPQSYVAGTKMTFSGIQDPERRADPISGQRAKSSAR